MQRLGVRLEPRRPDLTLAHGPLMACGFLGALIALERAVACGARWTFAAPLLLAAGALALVPDWARLAGGLMIAGSLALVGAYGVILRRRAAAEIGIMTAGAVALLLGNIFWAAGVMIPLMVYWWAAFLLLTIFGERLELSWLRRSSRLRTTLAWLAVAVYGAGVGLAAPHPVRGMRLAGAGMLALALWLLVYDRVGPQLARGGLARYIGANLGCGQLWLLISAGLWTRYAGALYYHYDALLHSLFLGFVMTMVFAHAPIIFPAISGRPLRWSRWFYLPAALLQVSLAGRIAADLAHPTPVPLWQLAGLLNIVALLLFLATVAVSARAGKKQAGASPLSAAG